MESLVTSPYRLVLGDAKKRKPTFRHRALIAEARVRELEAWLKLAEIERTGEIPFHAKHSGKARSTAIVAKRKEKS